MKSKNNLIILSIITIISFIIGLSYAYFVPIIIGNDTASTHNTKAGTLKLTYNGTNVLSLNNAAPGDTSSTTFTVTNSGTLPINSYRVYFSKLVNEFINNEVVYTLTCISSDANPCLGKEESPVPTKEELSLTQDSIASGTTHTYTLSVTFIEKSINQNYNQDKKLNFTITIDEMKREPAVLIARYYEEWNETPNQFWVYERTITEITLESTVNIPENAIETWDVSENQDEGIMAYIIDDGLGTNTYHLFIQSDKEIFANPKMDRWFSFSNWLSGTSKLTQINGLNLLNTSNVTNMASMFSFYNGVDLDLSTFDTSNVIDMSSMFRNCSSLTSLDLRNSIINSETYMTGIFCYHNDDLEINVTNNASKIIYEEMLSSDAGCLIMG